MGLFSSLSDASGTSTVGTLVAESKGKNFFFVSINDPWRIQFRIVDERVRGRPINDVIKGETGENLLRCMEESVAKRRILTRRLCVPRGLRNEWFILEIAPEETDEDEQPRMVTVTCMDVTELTECEAVFSQVQGFDRYLSHSTDHMQEPVLICDMKNDGVPIVHANGAFSRVFGYARPELLGRDPIHLMFHDHRAQVLGIIEHAYSANQPEWHPLLALNKNGMLVESEVVFDLHRNDADNVCLLRLTFLVDRKSGNRLTPEEHRRLQLDALLMAAATLINDFNNLLAVMLGNDRLLSRSTITILEVVRYSKACATQAADVLFDLVRGTPPEQILQRAHIAAAGQVPVPAPQQVPAAVTLPPGLRVMVVDDEPSVREIIIQGLSGVGCETSSASAGEEALATLNQLRLNPSARQFDVVVADFSLNGLSGLEVMQAMRTVGSRIPFVLVSGYFTQQARDMAEQEGSVVLLEKPFRFEELAASIQHVIAISMAEPNP